jgi:hypothetical protein
MIRRSSAIRALLSAASLAILLSATAIPASAATGTSRSAKAPQALQTTTNCHWHYDGNVYWAHCYATGGRYQFRMHIYCPYDLFPDHTSAWVWSPDQPYSSGIRCDSGAAEFAWVDTL